MKHNTTIMAHPERQRILDQALDARTLVEIEKATQALREWVRCHPEDVGIQEAFEGLALMRDIAEEQEAERARTLEPTMP
jgi:hypothetical protein